MNLSRRWFIGGAVSALAFGGCKMFTAPIGKYSSGKRKLSFGVISDVHIRYDYLTHQVGTNFNKNGETLEKTLTWFRDQGVDAVVIAGDIADYGINAELQLVADVWNKVFPDNKAPDGRTVEKVFVSGNHDIEGFKYGKFGLKCWSDEKELAKNVLVTDFKKNWEKIFNEEYSDIYKKEINGYTFIGQHWANQGWGKNCKFDLIRPFMEANKSKINTSLPFFYVQHPHPKNTCHGPRAWGADVGITTQVLNNFPTAVAFSGHSHYPLADKDTIWQGGFTSIGTASLRYLSFNDESILGGKLPAGFENSRTFSKKSSKPIKYMADENKVMTGIDWHNMRQGMLIKVFDDCMTILRRDFVHDMMIGEEWVMPLSTAEGKPFAFAEHAKRIKAPEFPKDAKVTINKTRGKNRGKKDAPSVEKDILAIDFPNADATGIDNLSHYEISVEAKDPVQNQLRRMISANVANPGKKAKEFTLKIALDTLPENTKYRFVIYPVSSLGQKGRFITSDWV